MYIQQWFFTFDTHLHPLSHHQTRAALQSFTKLNRRFLNMIPKKCSRGIDKNCNRPWPWAQFHFFYYKMEKEWRSVFQDSYTPLLKQSPSLGFFQGGIKTKETEEETGLGRARGQAQWYRQLGSPFLRCRLYNLLPNTGWSSSFRIQLPGLWPGESSLIQLSDLWSGLYLQIYRTHNNSNHSSSKWPEEL